MRLLQYISPFHVFLASLLIGLLAFGALLIPKAQALEDGERLFMIHDRGVEHGIISDASSLREVLEEADISLDDNDRVEPSLDEELVANQYQVNIYRARPVVIVDGNVRQLVMSAYQTPKQIAAHADIALRDEDEATVDLNNNFVSDGASLRMTIDRATPVTLQLYGKTDTVYTQASTVGDFLAEKNIHLGDKDDMSHQSSDKITEGMSLSIWRNGKQTVTQEEPVEFEIEQIKDANREVGYREVTTPGKKGKKTVTYEIIMQDGKEVSRTVIQSVVTEQTVKQVEVVGAKVEGPEAIMAKIRTVAAAKGIDAQRVLLIAKCESKFNPTADSGYYKGLFQHDPGYWPARAAKYGFAGASYFDVDAQIGVSTSMMAAGGWSHWGCDPGPQ